MGPKRPESMIRWYKTDGQAGSQGYRILCVGMNRAPLEIPETWEVARELLNFG